MTNGDIDEVELKLGIRVPPDYRQFMLSQSSRKIAGLFDDTKQIISANERAQQMCWLGRPLERVFFIFATDELGHEIFMDLDIPGPAIMVADYDRKRGRVQALTFKDWIAKHNHIP